LESAVDADGSPDRMAACLAGAKVKDFNRPLSREQRPLEGELAYERRRLADRGNNVYGLLYDAYAFFDICRSIIAGEESRSGQLHVVFTNQLIGSWDCADRRYHARTVLCGSPAIVSISGLIEAPAKAPGYYLARRGAEAFGLDQESRMELADSFADDCLGLGDPRLTEVAKGYAMQAIFYRLTGEAFCADAGCRLYNAHWQRELLEAQLGGDHEYCREHEALLQRLAKDG